MGHHQLYGLAHTPSLKRVIAKLGIGAGGGMAVGVAPDTLEGVAAAMLEATDDGLDRAKGDEGLGYCVYLMASLTQAATAPDFATAIAQLGLPPPFAPKPPPGQPEAAPSEYTVFDLVSGFSAAVDRHLRQTRSRTDIGELAQLAASESLTALCSRTAETLFESTRETVQQSLRGLANERGFGTLAHDFFARLSRRYLEYHLSRELSNHVGAGRRFATVGDHNAFLRQLDDHCRVATGAMRQFAGEWYSLHKWRQDITLRRAKGFAAVAVDKVRDALKFQEARDAN